MCKKRDDFGLRKECQSDTARLVLKAVNEYSFPSNGSHIQEARRAASVGHYASSEPVVSKDHSEQKCVQVATLLDWGLGWSNCCPRQEPKLVVPVASCRAGSHPAWEHFKWLLSLVSIDTCRS